MFLRKPGCLERSGINSLSRDLNGLDAAAATVAVGRVWAELKRLGVARPLTREVAAVDCVLRDANGLWPRTDLDYAEAMGRRVVKKVKKVTEVVAKVATDPPTREAWSELKPIWSGIIHGIIPENAFAAEALAVASPLTGTKRPFNNIMPYYTPKSKKG